MRDSVVRVVEVLVYVGAYFAGAVGLFAANHPLLILPMLMWLGCYLAVMRYFIPRLQHIAMQQADARSLVTGRVVDSYSNITTVKMFAHTRHEDEYARQSMQEFLAIVHVQMRLITQLVVVLRVLNVLLLAGIACLGLWLWQESAITAGAVAFALGLVLRLEGFSHWVLWEVSHLFEDIGVVQTASTTSPTTSRLPMRQVHRLCVSVTEKFVLRM